MGYFYGFLTITDTEFVSSYLDEVVCVRDHHYVWGLREVLSAVSPTRLQKYSWLVTNLSSFLSVCAHMIKSILNLVFNVQLVSKVQEYFLSAMKRFLLTSNLVIQVNQKFVLHEYERNLTMHFIIDQLYNVIPIVSICFYLTEFPLYILWLQSKTFCNKRLMF